MTVQLSLLNNTSVRKYHELYPLNMHTIYVPAYSSALILMGAPGSDIDYWAQFGLISPASHFVSKIESYNKLGQVDLSQL